VWKRRAAGGALRQPLGVRDWAARDGPVGGGRSEPRLRLGCVARRGGCRRQKGGRGGADPPVECVGGVREGAGRGAPRPADRFSRGVGLPPRGAGEPGQHAHALAAPPGPAGGGGRRAAAERDDRRSGAPLYGAPDEHELRDPGDAGLRGGAPGGGGAAGGDDGPERRAAPGGAPGPGGGGVPVGGGRTGGGRTDGGRVCGRQVDVLRKIFLRGNLGKKDRYADGRRGAPKGTRNCEESALRRACRAEGAGHEGG